MQFQSEEPPLQARANRSKLMQILRAEARLSSMATRRSTPSVNKGRCHTTEDDDATVHIMAHCPPLIAYHLSRTYDIGNGFPVLSNGVQKRKVDFLAKKIWEKPVNITLHNFDTRGTRPAILGRFGGTVWEE